MFYKILIIILSISIFIPNLGFAQTQDTTLSQTTTVKRNTGIIAPKRLDVPGQRYSLATGQLYIPDYFKPKKDGGFNLVVFFHGAAWCSEQVFEPAHKNAVLVSITLKSYPEVFQDTTRFQEILDEVNLTLERRHLCYPPSISVYTGLVHIAWLDFGENNNHRGKDEIVKSVFLTTAEHSQLIEKFGEVKAKDKIEALSLYKCSKGKKYADDYATILNWDRKDKEKSTPRKLEGHAGMKTE